MSFNPSADGPSILNSHRSVNEYGETEIKQIGQQQKRFSDDEISEIAQEYRSGKTTYELAEQYGCARHTIVTALKKMGITATKAKAQEAIDADNVIRLYNEYETCYNAHIPSFFKTGCLPQAANLIRHIIIPSNNTAISIIYFC